MTTLPLEKVYGEWLTGNSSNGWLECHDPFAPGGDKHPSAGVATGLRSAERGTFHSFRTGDSLSLFDFLVKRGVVPDHPAAIQWLARETGIRPPRTIDEHPILAEFLRNWPLAEDDDARYRLVVLVLQQLRDEENHLVRDQVTERVRRVTGMSARALREAARDTWRPKVSLENLPDRDPGGRVLINWVSNRETNGILFERITRVLVESGRWLRYGEDMVCVVPGVGPIVATRHNVTGLLNTFLEIRRFRDGRNGPEMVRYELLAHPLDRALVSDAEVLAALPRLDIYTRAPIFDKQWRLHATPGFRDGIFYDGPTIPSHTGPPRRLDELLNGVRWLSPIDRVNYIGMVLSYLTAPVWNAKRGFLVVHSAREGAGKTTLALAIAALLEGQTPGTTHHGPEEELSKRIGAKLDHGARLIVIDNIHQSPLRSALLESLITDPKPGVRRLGGNEEIRRSTNDMLIAMTLNMAQLKRDLRRRAVPVGLDAPKDSHEIDWGATEDWLEDCAAARLEVSAELIAMVRSWLEKGRPRFPHPPKHSTGNAWARTMDAILRCNGQEGFLANLKSFAQGSDPKWQLLKDIAFSHRHQEAAPSQVWVSRLGESGHDDVLRGKGDLSERAKSTIVGLLFNDYAGDVFTVGGAVLRLVQTWPRGREHKPFYQFIEEGSAA